MKDMMELMNELDKTIDWSNRYKTNDVRATVEDTATWLKLIMKLDDDGKMDEVKFFNETVKVLCAGLSEMMRLDPNKESKYEIRRVTSKE